MAEVNIQTDRHTWKCQIATILTTGPLGKQNLSNENNNNNENRNTLVQKLWLNKNKKKRQIVLTFSFSKLVKNTTNFIKSKITREEKKKKQ